MKPYVRFDKINYKHYNYVIFKNNNKFLIKV